MKIQLLGAAQKVEVLSRTARAITVKNPVQPKELYLGRGVFIFPGTDTLTFTRRHNGNWVLKKDHHTKGLTLQMEKGDES